MHCTPACSLLWQPKPGTLGSLITPTAEDLFMADNVARLNVHNCLEWLWEGLVIFTRGISKVPSVCGVC